MALAEAGDRGSVVPRHDRPGDRADHHLGHGRAAPGDHRRPPGARVQGRGQRRPAAGRLPRDHRARRRRRGQATSARPAAAASTATCSCTSSRRAGKGIVFEDATVGGAMPREFIPAVERGVRESLARGVMAGYPVIDVAVDADRRQLPRGRLAARWPSRSPARWALQAAAREARPGAARADHAGRGR